MNICTRTAINLTNMEPDKPSRMKLLIAMLTGNFYDRTTNKTLPCGKN